MLIDKVQKEITDLSKKQDLLDEELTIILFVFEKAAKEENIQYETLFKCIQTLNMIKVEMLIVGEKIKLLKRITSW